MKLAGVLGITSIVLCILMIVAALDDIRVRGLLEAESTLAKEQRKENETVQKQLRADLKKQEITNAKLGKRVRALDDELSAIELRERQARKKRATQGAITSTICTDKAANERLAQAISRYRNAVNSFRDAVGDYRIAVAGISKDAQQCTQSLVSCQGWVDSVCRAGLCER